MAVQYRDVNNREDVDFYIEKILRGEAPADAIIDVLAQKLQESNSGRRSELLEYAFRSFDAMDKHNEHGSGRTELEKSVHYAASRLGQMRRG